MTGSFFRCIAPAVWLLVAAAICPPTAAAAASSPRIAFDERLADPPVLAAALDAMGRPPAFPLLARVIVDRRDLESRRTGTEPGGAFDFAALERRLALYQSKKIPVWLVFDAGDPTGAAAKPSDSAPDLVPAPAGTKTADEWTRLFRALAPRLAGRVRVFELVVAPATTSNASAIAFDLKRAAVELRALNPEMGIALGAARQPAMDDVARVYTADVASYVDALVVGATADGAAAAGAGTGAGPLTLAAARTLLDKVDRSAAVYERGLSLRGAADAAARAFVSGELWRLGTASVLASYEARAELVRAALLQAATIQDLIAGELTRLDDQATRLTVTRANGAPVRHALLYDTSTFGTYLVYAAGDDSAPATPHPSPLPASGAREPGAGEAVRVSLNIATDVKPRVRDPFASTGGAREVTDFARERDAQRSTFAAPLAPRPLLLDFNDALSDIVAERNEVKGRAMLSVGEIIARHQQAQAAQDAVVDHYTASARMQQHFRPSVADPGYDVVTENRFYVDRDGVEWEELSFSVNGSKWKEDRPPFPLLQPEKVLSVPLTLRLSDDYTYRLDGVAAVEGRECYVVQFTPSNAARSLYRGTIWIDTETFVQHRLQAVQTQLSAPVVSNEETHHFRTVGSVDGRAIVLPTKMVARQIVLIAGRNMLVEKDTTFAEHEVNGDDFRERRQIARSSNHIMYRDTDRGVRYYVKEGAQRVVSERSTTSAKAMAMGVTLDPSYDFPLPIFGINYLDFDFGGPDSQLALLFGGVLALGNVQRPKLIGPLDGSVDFFAIAVPGTDKLYDEGGEREAERLLTWPASTGVNLGYQFTSFQKLAAQYQFKFDGFLRERTTSEDYVLPKTTTTHGVGLSYEYRRAGYSIAANGTWYGRARWAPWGEPDALQATARTYEKYSVNVSKDWFVGLFQKIHVNGAWFGGRRLDRFSQYQFGLFDDTRIHGVPASGVRMSELAMARGSYTFNIFEQYRFDLFLEQAMGRDRERGTDWDAITGLGVALNVKGPWNTILRTDVGRSFLPSRYRDNGSTVVQVLLLKPLKGR